MAWSSVHTLSSVGNTAANQSSSALTISAAASAGNVVVLVIAVDNAGTTDGDEGAVTSVTDSAGGNIWVKAKEFAYTRSSAQGGSVCSVWYCQLTNGIASSGTITASFSNSSSRDASALTAWEYSIAAGTVVSVEATNTEGGTAAQPSALDATTPNAEFLRVRGFSGESNKPEDWVVTSGWTRFTLGVANVGTAAASQKVSGEWHISTGTSDQSSGTIGTYDHASCYVAFKAIAPPAGEDQASTQG